MVVVAMMAVLQLPPAILLCMHVWIKTGTHSRTDMTSNVRIGTATGVAHGRVQSSKEHSDKQSTNKATQTDKMFTPLDIQTCIY
jgi:hypothetical protein